MTDMSPRFAPAGYHLGTKCMALLARMGVCIALLDAGGEVAVGAGETPLQRATTAPRGTLRSPYTDWPAISAEGHKIYLSMDCGSCHGGGGGGGMAPPLTNPVWIYGNDDDTLFRIIVLGTGEAFKRQGFRRKGSEAVVGPMPPFGETLKSDDEVWKIIAWIRSVSR